MKKLFSVLLIVAMIASLGVTGAFAKPADASITLSPATDSATAGAAGSKTATITANDFDTKAEEVVVLSVVGVNPASAGVSASVSGNTLTVSYTAAATAGDYVVTVKGQVGDKEGKPHKATADYKLTLGSAPAAAVVTFNANGGKVNGKNTDDITTVNKKVPDASWPTATKDGATFDGWYTLAEGGNKVEKGQEFTENTTLFAHYKASVEQCTVKVIGIDAKTLEEIPSIGTLYNGKAAKGTNTNEFLNGLGLELDRYGYIHDEWYKDGKQYKFGEDTKINGWTNAYVKYTKVEHVCVYAVTADATSLEGATKLAEGIYEKGSKLADALDDLNLKLDKKGYTHEEWFKGDSLAWKFADDAVIEGWTNVAVKYTPNTEEFRVYPVMPDQTQEQAQQNTPLHSGTILFDTNVKSALADLNLDLEKPGYHHDEWYKDGMEYKFENDTTVNGWTNVYVKYTACVDNNNDHMCDVGGEQISECKDDDSNHLCDICGGQVSECVDEDNDHLCDICGGQVSECVDADNDHLCDICGGQVSECVDADNDHLCDICGGQVSECVDADNDHLCDICGGQVSECVDEDSDHLCDICGGQVSECVDADNDHLCDICGGQVSECADEDSDHLCDICGGQVSECADEDSDHMCDICGEQVSECADKDKDHLCDLCGKQVSEHSYKLVKAQLDPTCTKAGHLAYYQCETCKLYFFKTDDVSLGKLIPEEERLQLDSKAEYTLIGDKAALKTWLAEGGDGYLAALGHDMGEWKDSEDGKTHTRACQREGCKYTEKEKHVYKDGVCEICGAKEPKPAPAKPKPPKTGDESNVALWAVLVLGLGSGATAVVLKKKHN